MQNDNVNYQARLEVSTRAFNTGCLIYSQDTCKWYTPREFLNSNEKVKVKTFGLQDYSNLTLIYPKHAIQRKLEDLRNTQKEFDEFMLKVVNAFDFNPAQLKAKKP